MVVGFLPLVLAAGLVAVVVAASLSDRVDAALTRVALAAFGSHVRSHEDANGRQRRLLQAAHVSTTYHSYAARTLLFAAVAGVVGSILGLYLVWGTLLVLGVPAETVRAVLPGPLSAVAVLFGVPDLPPLTLFGLLLASNATLGVAGGLLTYQFRWWLPEYTADARSRQIDESMERTVAFLYALSRSGMAFPDVMRALADHRRVYGAAAEELDVAARDVRLFGTDVLEALERVAHRTPSDQFEEFAQNLVSVLRSGQSLSTFLEDQYERFKEESRAQQRQFLDLLATMAEAYVTVLVAGPLFLITILVIVGLVNGGTLPFLRTFTYLLIPLATFGFVVFVDSLTESIDLSTGDRAPVPGPPGLDRPRRATGDDVEPGRTDGGHSAADQNAARLRAYNRFRGVRRTLKDPVRSLVERPVTLLYVTAPIATLFVMVRLWTLFSAGALSLRTVDDVVVQAVLFLAVTFAVVAEVSRHRVRRIEAAVPDFLDRLASVNEAGATVIESIERVSRSDLGALDEELDRIRRDVAWGSRVETAFERFERRVDAVAITRAVTLVTNAMHASGDLGPVLRIAADQAQAARRLRRERRQELFTYLMVVYLSFFVFLAIVVALSIVFLPSVPTTEQFSGTFGGVLNNLSAADKAAYELVFLHSALVQGVCSGFVAGLMGDGDLAAGAKHATIMLGIAYLVMVIVA